MITKTFLQMMKVDISEYVKKRDGIEYLPWADCKYLLHQNGAEVVMFEPLTDPVTNSSVFKTDRVFTDKSGNTNCCYEVAVQITIDNDTFVMRTPIMNGANPVKDNSLSQQRVWAAQARAFVKGVAMKTGLGFQLWLKGDLEADYAEDLGKHQVYKVQERIQEEYTSLMTGPNKMSQDQIAEKLKMLPVEIKHLFEQFEIIDNFEKKLLDLGAYVA